MSRFLWSNKWSIDNDEIDRQHMKLVSLIAELQNIHGTGITAAELHETIRFLSDYAKIHFTYEESFMNSINYPGLNEHRILHDEFSEYIRHLREKENISDIINSDEVLLYLKAWLKNHICLEDKKISGFLKNREN